MTLSLNPIFPVDTILLLCVFINKSALNGYSEKEEIDVLQCDLEVAPAELKGNFLKERIERLEESEEELKKENQEIRKENEEMHLQIDG